MSGSSQTALNRSVKDADRRLVPALCQGQADGRVDLLLGRPSGHGRQGVQLRCDGAGHIPGRSVRPPASPLGARNIEP